MTEHKIKIQYFHKGNSDKSPPTKIASKKDDSSYKLIFKWSIDEKVYFLREKGIIGKDERDKKSNIVKYVKRARNFSVHDIKRFPDASESMALLGDCLDILKINKRLEKI